MKSSLFKTVGCLASLSLASLGFSQNLTPQAPKYSLKNGAVEAFDRADSAIIYVMQDGVEVPVTVDPAMLQRLGCRYAVDRRSPQWNMLRNAVSRLVTTRIPVSKSEDVHVGLQIVAAGRVSYEIFVQHVAPSALQAYAVVNGKQAKVSPGAGDELRSFPRQHHLEATVVEGAPPPDIARLCSKGSR